MAFDGTTRLDDFGEESQAGLTDFPDAADDPSVPPGGFPAYLDELPAGHIIAWHGNRPHVAPTEVAAQPGYDDPARPLPREVLDVTDEFPRLKHGDDRLP